MSKLPSLLLTTAAMLCVSSVGHTATNPTIGLEAALSCNSSSQPHELVTWIKELRGGVIIGSTTPGTISGSEYTLPNPIYVLGFPATRINIRIFHGEEHDLNVYETIFLDKPFRAVIKVADLAPDEAGNYQQRVGDNHLFLREQAGITYLTCAIGMHRNGLQNTLRSPQLPQGKTWTR